MGITIHYKGKAKSLEAIESLIGELQEMAEKFGWEHGLVEKEVKGELCPSWGYGFGYVPSKEQMEKENIEYFAAIVTKDCNGYFKFSDSKYQEDYRNTFKKGKWPKFSVDTKVKGIWLDIHPECETLEFMFDLATLELGRTFGVTPELELWGRSPTIRRLGEVAEVLEMPEATINFLLDPLKMIEKGIVG